MIRPVRPDELNTTRRFFSSMFEEIGMPTSRWLNGWEGRYDDYVRRRIAAGEGQVHVAVRGTDIVGCSHGIVREGYPSEIVGRGQGYIFGVYVVPEARQSGIGQRLVLASIDFLQSVGCNRIRLHAAQAARPIYERLGFKPTNEMQLVRDAEGSA